MEDFITYTELENRSLVISNIDARKVYPAIRRTQLGEIKSLLGKDLYDYLQTNFSSLPSVYANLLDHLKDLMCPMIEIRITYYLNNEISNKGVGKNNDQYLQVNSNNENSAIFGQFFRDVAVYKTIVLNYLEENKDSIPEWKINCDSSRKDDTNGYSSSFSIISRT